MIARRPLLLLAIAIVASLSLLPGASSALAATGAPAWKLSLTTAPPNFAPDSSGNPQYLLFMTNIGAAPSSGPITITYTLPTGLSPGLQNQDPKQPPCSAAGQTITCTVNETFNPTFGPGVRGLFQVPVEVDQVHPDTLTTSVTVSGGGSLPATTQAITQITDALPSFGFLPGEAGLSSVATEPDGVAATSAGSHPYQYTIDLGFPAEERGNGTFYVSVASPRDVLTDLPPGTIINPATPVLCTEAQLTSQSDPGCPRASQIGIVNIPTPITGSVSTVLLEPTPLYNMVPPPGKPSSFGFDVSGVGLFPHIIGSLRSDGDYGLSGGSTDILALGKHPVFALRLELWGEPTSSDHDLMRSPCIFTEGTCPVPEEERTDTALITMPSECSGEPTLTRAHANSWEEPDVVHEASYESADLEGNPVSIGGCNGLDFAPRIDAAPTTTLTDSPSGLDFNLHQPQDPRLEHRSPAALRDATVTLPEGIAVNPASAQGQGACSSDEVGLSTAIGATPIHFTKTPDSCPEAAKIGTVQVRSPLLAEYDAQHKLTVDPETGQAIPRTLEGAVYLAKPFDNPFDSLLAIYLSINDPQSGTIVKFAGRVQADPQSGRLSTVVSEGPQLPIEDIDLHLFKGARASLITPLTCATHTTTSELTPWSAPEGAEAHPQSSFQTTAAPGVAACPTTDSGAPNSPSFDAGTITRQAATYSPFVLKLSREDGTQRLTKIDTTLPPGLAAKFAGVGECSEAQIAAAGARSHPEEGILEQQNPSCPASSRLGRVLVGAGAGPTPLYTEGTAYLSGPYKSAPFSLAIITPAIAGPFDLGTVVVRTALYVNPDTAQGRAVSDPLPTILDGIPLDVRSVAIKMDRHDFTLNPTNCNPFAVTGTATSAFGAVAPLTSPFQVGGCQELPFKPRLSLQLKGKTKRTSHPTLIANLAAKPGEANIARAQVKLPKAAFLDNSNINTICTRVQFAADTCPPGSIYGKASATTPLLDAPLSGAVYLRSSSHALPDLVVKLRGPDAQPIEIVLAGRTDSVKGALRNTFEAVPDAPVTKFHLELFGGKRGLIELSSGLCAHPNASVQFDGQNGKVHDANPVVGTSCPKKDKRHKGKRRAKR